MSQAGRKANPISTVAAMDGSTFFTRLCTLMAANPPAAADQPAVRRFASLGITPGGKPTTEAAVLDNAVKAAKQRIAAYRDPRARTVDGWVYSLDWGTYSTNYPLRGYISRFGLGANLAEDALYPAFTAKADDKGIPRRFRLHFRAGQLPPVNAFWSLTAYDADGFLVANPTGIFSLGDQLPLTKNADGSVDITVQNADPGVAVPRNNWLPIPATGEFSLTMRLYAPKPEALQGSWRPPSVDIL